MMERIRPISRKLSGTVDVCGTVASVFLLVAALAPPAFGTHIVRVSVDDAGAQGNGASDHASVSADGRFVAFSSTATNLVVDDTNGVEDVFLRDTCRGAPPDCAPSTVRVSVASDGTQGNGGSWTPAVSADGRFVAFASWATNLVADDTNGAWDVFLRDTCRGAPAGCSPSTVRVSVASDGTEANALPPGFSPSLSISADGRFVAFDSDASNLVPGAPIGFYWNAFVRDTCVGAPAECTPSTAWVSVASDGTPLWDEFSIYGGYGSQPSISADGRFVAFASSSCLVTGEVVWFCIGKVHVRDTCAGAPVGCLPSTVPVDATSGGLGDKLSYAPAINADGRFVAFVSTADLVPGFPSGGVFLHDTCLGAPAGCTPGTIGVPDAGDRPSISADGRFVAFGYGLVGVHDTCLGAPAGCTPGTVMVGVGTSAAISADGGFVGFASEASNLVADDTNGARDVFLATYGPGDPPPPPNAPPVASFSFTCTALSCSVDGSGSSDSDGAIASHAWDFGDGTTGSGATVTHPYAAAGTYTITLTVTDDSGAVGTQSQTVTVSPVFMHVGDLDRAITSQGSTWTAIVTATVHDGSHRPVANATVTGAWSAGGTGSCTTNGSGTCTVSKSGIPKKTPSVTLTVVSVAHATLSYASAANHDPEGDSSGASITVTRP